MADIQLSQMDSSDNWVYREYSLPGSYRKIIHKPPFVQWRHIRYIDPDLSFSQSDEDRILNVNLPAEDDPEGKFKALQVELELSSSVYATMALREITREETSTWHQIGLTATGEDQEFKGVGGGEGGEEGEGGDGEEDKDGAEGVETEVAEGQKVKESSIAQ